MTSWVAKPSFGRPRPTVCPAWPLRSPFIDTYKPGFPRWIDVPPTRRADLRQQKGPGARVEVAHEQRDVVQFQCVRHSKSKACCGIGIERGSPLPHKSIS